MKIAVVLGWIVYVKLVSGDPVTLRSARYVRGERRFALRAPVEQIRGQGQKSIGMLKTNAREIVWSVLEATADGSLFLEDPAEALVLLPIGADSSIGNPRFEEEAEAGEPEE